MTRTGQGFTLIELMVTVSVAAVLLAVGVPSFQTTVKNNRLTAAANSLVGALNLARSEAIKRGVFVTFCKRNGGGTDCDNSASWNDGWIVFSDLDRDGVFDDDGDANLCEPDEDCLVRVYPPLNAQIDLGFSRDRVTFDPNGFSQGYNGTFKFCDDRGAQHARARILSNTGRLRGSKDSNGDGIHEDGSGNNLAC